MNTFSNKTKKHLAIIRPEKKIEIHRADWVLCNPQHIIQNGYIKVENQIIKEVSKDITSLGNLEKDSIIDHGSGVLMSPLVNAHTHISLSCFKDKLIIDCDFKNKFEIWVRKLIELKEKIDEKSIVEHAEKAVLDLVTSGVLFLGEIASSDITKRIIEKSPLSGIIFYEFLGSKYEEDEINLFSKTRRANSTQLNFSVAGHAPHTTSPELLMFLKQKANSANLPFSIHTDESPAEREFISTVKGRWADLLEERKINFSSWNLPQKTPVQHLSNLNLLDPLTLLVHCLNVDNKDLDIIVESGAKVCVCPRSNMSLHGKLPRIEKMLSLGIKPALGTDSLASCDSLNIFDEMRYIKEQYKNISNADIISMATLYGGDVLGMNEYTGNLEKGKTANMLYIPIFAKNKTELLEQIIKYE